MRPFRAFLLPAALALVAGGCGDRSDRDASRHEGSLEVPAGIDHAAWDGLLAKYVDERGLVAYESWKAATEDRESLRAYLRQFAAEPRPAARGEERAASLIDAYNAFTVAWVLERYPVASIRSTPRAFQGRRHEIGGRTVSLDDIEHGTLRPFVGFRIHAALSCASRSCPPLAHEAYRPWRLEERLDSAMGRWLAREDLNRYFPDQKKVEISEVFRWNLQDFQRSGGVRSVLGRYGPARSRGFLSEGDYAIGYLAYDWGLNDQGKEGRRYGKPSLLWDQLRDRLRRSR